MPEKEKIQFGKNKLCVSSLVWVCVASTKVPWKQHDLTETVKNTFSVKADKHVCYLLKSGLCKTRII